MNFYVKKITKHYKRKRDDTEDTLINHGAGEDLK